LLKVGLTGGIASGKSVVGEMFVALGAHLIQADAISHQLMQPGEAVYREVVRHFGSGILNADGTVNRSRLAEAASRARGYLDGRSLAEVFAWLRPNDLIWNYWVNNYLLGNDPPAYDILYWNNDTTRLPAHPDRHGVDHGWLRPGGRCSSAVRILRTDGRLARDRRLFQGQCGEDCGVSRRPEGSDAQIAGLEVETHRKCEVDREQRSGEARQPRRPSRREQADCSSGLDGCEYPAVSGREIDRIEHLCHERHRNGIADRARRAVEAMIATTPSPSAPSPTAPSPTAPSALS